MFRVATFNGGRPIDGSSGCLVISGVPGAGKTTVAGLVADAFPRSAVTDADALAWMGRPDRRASRRGTRPTHAPYAKRVPARRVVAEAGFFPVIDHVVADQEMLEAMLGWLQPRPVSFVTLAPDLSTARARNATRPERERIDYDISGLCADTQRELSARGWWFDTSTTSPEDTAQRIIAEAGEGGRDRESRRWSHCTIQVLDELALIGYEGKDFAAVTAPDVRDYEHGSSWIAAIVHKSTGIQNRRRCAEVRGHGRVLMKNIDSAAILITY